MSKKILKFYQGNQKFVAYNDGDGPFCGGVEGPHGTAQDDIATNAYINSASVSITKGSNDIINISFTPCTNQTVLDKVAAGKTKVRLQLLVHSASEHYNNPIYLPETSWRRLHTDRSSRDRTFFYDIEKKFTRAYASGTRYGSGSDNQYGFSHFEGITWLELTASQLQSGSATLSPMSISYKYANQTPYTSTMFWYPDCYFDAETQLPTLRMMVEMYCPALYRRNKNMFDYEKAGNFSRSNIITMYL